MKDYITADEYLASLPEELQKEINEGAEKLIAEYTLQQIRKQSDLTQTEVASRMGISQPSVSHLEEHYDDSKISTLKRYCQAIDAVLNISITTKKGKIYSLPA